MFNRENAYIMHGYEEAAKHEIYFVTSFEVLRGYLAGESPETVIQTYNRIKPCTCGEKEPIAVETECMGDFSFGIECPKCGRVITRSMYDYDVKKEAEYIDLCIRDWNKGLCKEDIEAAKRRESERITLTPNDMVWNPLYPNNMPNNGLAGYYSLLFKKNDDGSVYGCKWTIKFQKEEEKPMWQQTDAKTEMYILFMKRYFNVQGPLYYPKPQNNTTFRFESEETFRNETVNDTGDFVRAYHTLEEAKEGAAARCGWQGLNRDTILNIPEAEK